MAPPLFDGERWVVPVLWDDPKWAGLYPLDQLEVKGYAL